MKRWIALILLIPVILAGCAGHCCASKCKMKAAHAEEHAATGSASHV